MVTNREKWSAWQSRLGAFSDARGRGRRPTSRHPIILIMTEAYSGAI